MLKLKLKDWKLQLLLIVKFVFVFRCGTGIPHSRCKVITKAKHQFNLQTEKKNFFSSSLLHDTCCFEYPSHLNDQSRTSRSVPFRSKHLVHLKFRASNTSGLRFNFHNVAMQRCHMPFHCTFVAERFRTEFAFEFSASVHQTVST